nr:unnamed protein product [Callosobruchus chinensis]
MIFRVPEDVL